MYYYLCEKAGDGTEENPFRPNYDGGFVWDPEAVCPHCNTYIIATDEETILLKNVTDLETACFARSLPISEVMKWFVGGK